MQAVEHDTLPSVLTPLRYLLSVECIFRKGLDTRSLPFEWKWHFTLYPLGNRKLPSLAEVVIKSKLVRVTFPNKTFCWFPVLKCLARRHRKWCLLKLLSFNHLCHHEWGDKSSVQCQPGPHFTLQNVIPKHKSLWLNWGLRIWRFWNCFNARQCLHGTRVWC